MLSFHIESKGAKTMKAIKILGEVSKVLITILWIIGMLVIVGLITKVKG